MLTYYRKRLGIDTIISFLYAANTVNYFSLGRGKKILSIRGYREFIFKGELYSFMLKRVDNILVQTMRMKKEFSERFHVNTSKIGVLENPFNEETIVAESNKNIEESIEIFVTNHKTICTVGAYKQDKGFWHLIKAFVLVKEKVPNAGLVFIGHNGEMEQRIKDMVEKTKYREDVLFLGYKLNPFKYIKKCDLYVCSSLYEGFPNALVEAMICGIAVISTDCKMGPREILADETLDEKLISDYELVEYGVLVPNFNDVIDLDVNNIEANEVIMANAITKLLLDDELRNFYMLRAKLRGTQFDTKVFLRKLIGLIG
jgi:glycosyltransferase involved in cell wall biosynthesis